MEEAAPTDVLLNSSPRSIRLLKAISNPTEAAINLLNSWNLAQLCDKFREQEVCTVAFQHITDTDISELIPKIGPRAIFRARLTEWRKQMEKQQSASQSCLPSTNGQDNRKRNFQTAFASNSKKKITTTNSNFVEPTVIKTEAMDSDEQQWLREVEELHDAVAAEAHEDESLLDTLPSTSNSSSPPRQPCDENEVDLLNDSDFLPEENNDTPNTSTTSENNSNKNAPTLRRNSNSAASYSQHNHERVNVMDILSNSYDGRKAIEYYASHKTFDSNHRKKIVKCIISIVIEKRVIMSVNCFDDLTQQLINLFPNEIYDNYYVPRIGLTCPRGSLYNKYLNMCRRLRRDGLLEYRVHRVNQKNKS